VWSQLAERKRVIANKIEWKLNQSNIINGSKSTLHIVTPTIHLKWKKIVIGHNAIPNETEWNVKQSSSIKVEKLNAHRRNQKVEEESHKFVEWKSVETF
jgi:hypothetical protein